MYRSSGTNLWLPRIGGHPHSGCGDACRTTQRPHIDDQITQAAHELRGEGLFALAADIGKRVVAEFRELDPAQVNALHPCGIDLGALAGIAAAEGAQLVHVKPHGALSNQSCEDDALADVVARAVRAVDRDLILLAPALSALERAGRRAGLQVACEAYADRAYTDAGMLVPRREAGAVLHGADTVVAHVRRMLQAGSLVSRSGKVLPTPMHSLCVHGDTPGAVEHARHLRAALEADGWRMVRLDEALKD